MQNIGDCSHKNQAQGIRRFLFDEQTEPYRASKVFAMNHIVFAITNHFLKINMYGLTGANQKGKNVALNLINQERRARD